MTSKKTTHYSNYCFLNSNIQKQMKQECGSFLNNKTIQNDFLYKGNTSFRDRKRLVRVILKLDLIQKSNIALFSDDTLVSIICDEPISSDMDLKDKRIKINRRWDEIKNLLFFGFEYDKKRTTYEDKIKIIRQKHNNVSPSQFIPNKERDNVEHYIEQYINNENKIKNEHSTDILNSKGGNELKNNLLMLIMKHCNTLDFVILVITTSNKKNFQVNSLFFKIIEAILHNNINQTSEGESIKDIETLIDLFSNKQSQLKSCSKSEKERHMKAYFNLGKEIDFERSYNLLKYLSDSECFIIEKDGTIKYDKDSIARLNYFLENPYSELIEQIEQDTFSSKLYSYFDYKSFYEKRNYNIQGKAKKGQLYPNKKYVNKSLKALKKINNNGSVSKKSIGCYDFESMTTDYKYYSLEYYMEQVIKQEIATNYANKTEPCSSTPSGPDAFTLFEGNRHIIIEPTKLKKEKDLHCKETEPAWRHNINKSNQYQSIGISMIIGPNENKLVKPDIGKTRENFYSRMSKELIYNSGNNSTIFLTIDQYLELFDTIRQSSQIINIDMSHSIDNIIQICSNYSTIFNEINRGINQRNNQIVYEEMIEKIVSVFKF